MKKVVLLSVFLSSITIQAQKPSLYGLMFPWNAAKPASIDSNPEDKMRLAGFLAEAAKRSEQYQHAEPLFRVIEKMFREISETGEVVSKPKLGLLYTRFSSKVVEASKVISWEASAIMLEHGLTTVEETRLWHDTLAPECNASNPCLALTRTKAWVNHWG